jgi:hypothetical protein
MKRRAALAIAVAAIASATIWAISPWATGSKEPWDAESLFYVASLVLGGFVSGLVIPRPLWGQYVGAVSGQLIYEVLFLEIGPLILVGAIFLLGYSLLFLGGAGAGSQVRLHFSERLTGRGDR